MYKVFIKDSSLNFTDNAVVNHDSLKEYKGIEHLKELVTELENHQELQHFELQVADSNKIWSDLNLHFTLIEAAGGVVKNSEGQILMIFRLGKWDLPKGKLEEKESIEAAAVREVNEECGISGLKVIRRLTDTYHTYEMKGEPILKRTYWFEMITDDKSELAPQTEEDIHEAVWVSPKQAKLYFNDSYASINWMIERHPELLD